MTLKRILLVDATSAAIFVIFCLGFTETTAGLLGLPAAVVAIAGWICIPSALLFAHQALRPSRSLVAGIVVGNTAWVLASLAVWLAWFGELTPIGHAVVLGQALAVEIFALLEWRGSKALRGPRAAAA